MDPIKFDPESQKYLNFGHCPVRQIPFQLGNCVAISYINKKRFLFSQGALNRWPKGPGLQAIPGGDFLFIGTQRFPLK